MSSKFIETIRRFTNLRSKKAINSSTASIHETIDKEAFKENLIIAFAQHNHIDIEKFFRNYLNKYPVEDFLSALEFAFSHLDSNPYHAHHSNRSYAIKAIQQLHDKLDFDEIGNALNIMCSYQYDITNLDLTYLIDNIDKEHLEKILLDNFDTIVMYEIISPRKQHMKLFGFSGFELKFLSSSLRLKSLFIEKAHLYYKEFRYNDEFYNIMVYFPELIPEIDNFFIEEFIKGENYIYEDELADILQELADYEKYEGYHSSVVYASYEDILNKICSYQIFYECATIFKEEFGFSHELIDAIVDREIELFIGELLSNNPFVCNDHVSTEDLAEFLCHPKAYDKFMDNLTYIISTNNLYFAAHLVELFGNNLPAKTQIKIARNCNIYFYPSKNLLG